MAAKLKDYVKQHVTIRGQDGVYLGSELDKVSNSVSLLNQAMTAGSAVIPISSLETIATGRFLGNISGSTASPSALTGTQVTANLDAFTTSLKGLVPSPGGTATGKVLKDNATWGTLADTDLTGAAWTAYTPSVSAQSGSFNSVSALGYHKVIGKTCFVKIQITVSDAGTAGTGTDVTLPFTTKTNAVTAFAGHNVTTLIGLSCRAGGGTTTLSVYKYDGTFAGGAIVLAISGVYEVA